MLPCCSLQFWAFCWNGHSSELRTWASSWWEPSSLQFLLGSRTIFTISNLPYTALFSTASTISTAIRSSFFSMQNTKRQRKRKSMSLWESLLLLYGKSCLKIIKVTTKIYSIQCNKKPTESKANQRLSSLFRSWRVARRVSSSF